MKIFEILAESKRDETELRRDYNRWKKLVNMPDKTIEWMIATNKVEQLGLTDLEFAKIHGKYSPKIPLVAIEKMRAKPFQQWEAPFINWMYRQIAAIEHFKSREGLYFKERSGKKIPSTKLKSLWMWGHVPQNYFPQKCEDKNESK